MTPERNSPPVTRATYRQTPEIPVGQRFRARMAGRLSGGQVSSRVGTQDAVPDPVPPGAVPPADAAQQALPSEPGLLQGPLLGDVARLGGRLDPVYRGVREQVAHQQPVRLSAVPMAAGLREQSDADLPVV